MTETNSKIRINKFFISIFVHAKKRGYKFGGYEGNFITTLNIIYLSFHHFLNLFE